MVFAVVAAALNCEFRAMRLCLLELGFPPDLQLRPFNPSELGFLFEECRFL